MAEHGAIQRDCGIVPRDNSLAENRREHMRVIWFLTIVCIFSGQTTAQQVTESVPISHGITISGGIGNYAVRDEYISEEKYSGSMPSVNLGWSRFHGNHSYFLNLRYRGSTEIKNYTITTNIREFQFSQGFLYPVCSTTLFSKDLFVVLGPITDLYFFYNKPRIAVSGFDYAQSFALLLSVGVRSDVILPLSKSFKIEGILQFDILSMGGRMVDEEEEDISPVKPLTIFAGTHGVFDIGIRYHVTERISTKVSLETNLTRITAWEPLLSARESFTIGITYGL